MIRAVLVVSVTLGTESELQRIIIQFRPSANCTLMPCDHITSAKFHHITGLPLSFIHLFLKLCPALHLRRRNPLIISRHQEENQECSVFSMIELSKKSISKNLSFNTTHASSFAPKSFMAKNPPLKETTSASKISKS